MPECDIAVTNMTANHRIANMRRANMCVGLKPLLRHPPYAAFRFLLALLGPRDEPKRGGCQPHGRRVCIRRQAERTFSASPMSAPFLIKAWTWQAALSCKSEW
jgi:hypothetical protein